MGVSLGWVPKWLASHRTTGVQCILYELRTGEAKRIQGGEGVGPSKGGAGLPESSSGSMHLGLVCAGTGTCGLCAVVGGLCTQGGGNVRGRGVGGWGGGGVCG